MYGYKEIAFMLLLDLCNILQGYLYIGVARAVNSESVCAENFRRSSADLQSYHLFFGKCSDRPRVISAVSHVDSNGSNSVSGNCRRVEYRTERFEPVKGQYPRSRSYKHCRHEQFDLCSAADHAPLIFLKKTVDAFFAARR